MGTTATTIGTIFSIIAEVASLFHVANGGTAPNPTPTDAFGGLPGLPGHPFLNGLKNIFTAQSTPPKS